VTPPSTPARESGREAIHPASANGLSRKLLRLEDKERGPGCKCPSPLSFCVNTGPWPVIRGRAHLPSQPSVTIPAARMAELLVSPIAGPAVAAVVTASFR